MDETRKTRRGYLTYSKLDPEHIRLLELKPATKRLDPIRCSLRTVPLGQAALDYEAISYVWGDKSLAKIVEVDGADVHVTGNLFDVLLNIRRQDSVRTVWIDALCINQEDLGERCHQVSIMGHIYREASGVLIYLGNEWDGLGIACEYLELAAQRGDAHFAPSLQPHLEVRGQNISTPYLRDNLFRLFSSAWFSRVWTVQEFVLARKTTFLCGATIVDGKRLEQGIVNIRQHAQDRCCGPHSILACGETFLNVMAQMEALNAMRTFPKAASFLETLHHCRQRRCTNPRDKIYGMLGMEFRGQASRLQPNYDISVERLFVDVAREQLEQTRTLDVLSCVVPGKRRTSLGIPSYVPDWTLMTKNILTHHLSVDHLMTLPHYNASGGFPAEFRIGRGNRAFTKGIAIDRIEALGPACFFSDLASCGQAKDHVKEARRLAGLPGRPPESLEAASARELGFWRTLCGNLAVHVGEESRDWRAADPAVDYESYLRWSDIVNDRVPSADPQLDDRPAFEDALVATLSARRFMRTREGHFGMAAPDSRRGDVVTILAGGRVPHVLREEPGNETGNGLVTYSFIGD
ncbi:Heterokaryon incompatibility protein 6, OR allele, partial [Colletotrichum shisoi]